MLAAGYEASVNAGLWCPSQSCTCFALSPSRQLPRASARTLRSRAAHARRRRQGRPARRAARSRAERVVAVAYGWFFRYTTLLASFETEISVCPVNTM
jgi:hypothetical protein